MIRSSILTVVGPGRSDEPVVDDDKLGGRAPDPGAAAAAVGFHLDRSAADVAGNLQGVIQ
jgi:hypothetical protein